MKRLRVRVRGLVQGVGFRPFVYRIALRHHLTGQVHNDEQGVLLEVQGAECEGFLRALRDEAPPLSRIDAVEPEEVALVEGEREFVIDASAHAGKVTVAIGPDHAPCKACLEELFDPQARRYLYPFLNCTHCGPRYTITRGLPYDRPQTSMARFPMCPDCEREYRDPLDRRFHAQPIACPKCGPHLRQLAPPPKGNRSDAEHIADVTRRLAAGEIVALKGAGGFLLACDAGDDEAVSKLRARKQRDAKPFACMVASLEAARALAQVTDEDAKLLVSSQRPVVLVRRKENDGLSPRVAPELAWIGLMLPSTPLHYVLFSHLRQGTVLVMTSANPGGEPLVIDDTDALARLGGIADCVITHDRDVVVRNDDSVVRTVAGAPTFIRRARGYVPEPVKLAHDVPPLLAVGGHLKTTVCFARGKEAWVSQHIGDLDDAATYRFLEETIEHLGRTLELSPELVAHDLHPDFLSTRKALELGVKSVGVQHHHAHVAAVLAEHGRHDPAVGLALDGYGYGLDGGAWGGELLFVDGAKVERLGHLRPIRLPGGDVAARSPWRMAAAALHELGRADEILPRFGAHGAGPPLLDMLSRGIRAPWTTSLGRFFDAACGLLGVRTNATYEGEAPMVLESLVTTPEVLAGAWKVDGGVLDLFPLLASLDGCDARTGANRFHGTLAAALIDWAMPAIEARGSREIVLGGGCVMNEVLTSRLIAGFSARGVKALIPRRVPANDGGLSLGQAWVAARSIG